VKIATIIVGILLTVGGVYCFAAPGATFLTLGWMIGVLLLTSGIETIAAYFLARGTGAVVWDLLCGVLTTLVAIAILTNGYAQLFTDRVLIFVFAFWMTASGVFRVAAALRLKALGVGAWVWTLIFGILSVLLGLYSFAHPVLTAFTIGFLIGLWMLTHGLNMVAFGAAMPGGKA
jgi:uncharacterized membrane protein HdeD (DUF308 family)